MMKYLEFSNKPVFEINDRMISNFISYAMQDSRVAEISLSHRNEKGAWFNVNIDFGKGEMLAGCKSLGAIAGLLHECNHERDSRLELQRIQEDKRKLELESSNENIALMFVEIMSKNIATINDLKKYHHHIFSGQSANFESRWWKAAEKTFSDFNAFENGGTQQNCLDVNFYRDNFGLISNIDEQRDANCSIET